MNGLQQAMRSACWHEEGRVGRGMCGWNQKKHDTGFPSGNCAHDGVSMLAHVL